MDERPPATTFVSTRKTGLFAALAFAGGFGAALLLVARFFLDAVAPPRDSSFDFPFEIVFALMACFAFSYGIALLRRPVRVVLEGDGLIVEGLLTRARFPWSEIAEVRRDRESERFGGRTCDVIVLCDGRGRKLAAIADTFDGFPAMVAAVEAGASAARGAPVYDRARDLERRRRKERRGRRFVMIALPCIVGMGLLTLGWGLHDWARERQLESRGVETEARVARHFMFNVTPRIEYEFEDDGGRTFRRDVMMDRAHWEFFRGVKSIPVRYLPSDPDWSRPLQGEVGGPRPLVMLVTGALCVALFGGLFLLVALGYDLDQKDGKLRIKRWADVDDALEGPAPVLPAVPLREVGGARSLPGGVKALVVLNAAFGTLGMLYNAGRIAVACLFAGRTVATGEVQVEVGVTLELWVLASANFVLALLLAVSAAGLHRLRPWGRALALAAAGGQLLSSVVEAAWRLSNVEAQAEASRAATAALILSVFLIALGAVYPAVLLCVLGRRRARETFAKAKEGGV